MATLSAEEYRRKQFLRQRKRKYINDSMGMEKSGRDWIYSEEKAKLVKPAAYYPRDDIG